MLENNRLKNENGCGARLVREMAGVWKPFNLARYKSILSIIFLSIALSNYSSIAKSQSRLGERYVNYLKEKKFDEAYAYVSLGNDYETILQTAYHLMFGAGVERDECGAVKLLESAYSPKRTRTVAALNKIYNGSWKAIASLEGSASASFELAFYYYATPQDLQLTILKGDEFFQLYSFINFKRAAKFGDKLSEKYISEILLKNPDLKDLKIDYSTTKIICPVRKKGADNE